MFSGDKDVALFEGGTWSSGLLPTPPAISRRAIHEYTRELTRTRTCEYFNSQTGTRTRANSFPRVTRTHESSTHELQVHPPSLYQKWHINRLSDALGTFYVIYSLYIYILYAYISREHF